MRGAILTLVLCAFTVHAEDMTLQECLTRTLSNNLDIHIQRLNTRMSLGGWNGSLGIFDPTITAEVSTRSTKSPSVWALQGAAIFKSEMQSASVTVGQLLPTGGTFSLTYSADRQENNSSFYDINPSYTSTLTLGLSQSLLKGFGSDITRYMITSGRYAYGTAFEQLRNQVMTSILDVEKAYWDLYYAQADLKVKERDLELARELLEDTQKRIDLGTQAPIDIYQSQVGVATREEAIIVAKNAVEAAQDRLRTLLNSGYPDDWDRPVRPIDTISVEEITFNLDESLALAMQNRPDVRMQAFSEQTSRLDYLVAKNNLLPSLDLNFSYWYSGIGGDTIIRDPLTGQVDEIIPGGISDANDQVFGGDFGNYSASLSFTMPIMNRDARAEKQIAEMKMERTQRQGEQLKQTVLVSVRQAIRNLQTAVKSLDAAKVSRVLAEKNLDAERKKYDNGMTTSFQVLEVEADLSEAKTRELMAMINYRKALADYHYAVGDLTVFEGMDVTGDPIPEESRWESMPVLSFGWWSKEEK